MAEDPKSVVESKEERTFILRQLLQDIERSNKPVKEIELAEICDSCPLVYGAEGSSRRRRLQWRFQNTIKKKMFDEYVKLLDKEKIPPGPHTLRTIRKRQDAQAASEDSDSSDSDISDFLVSEKTTATSTVTAAALPETKPSPKVSPVANLSKRFASSLKLKSSNRTSTMATNKPAPNALFSPGSPAPKQLPASINVASTAHSTDSPNDVMIGSHQVGTKEFPWVIIVDLHFPERNREFDIQRVVDIKHNNLKRTGFHIRIPVAPPDYDLWEASVVSAVPDPSLRNRVVQVKGPSSSFWCRDPERYHKKNVDCEATKEAHVDTAVTIKRAGEARQTSFWWLVFPETVQLNNQTFSDDDVTLTPCYNTMKVEADETLINKRLHAVVLWWRIAEVGGEKVHKQKAKLPPKALFGADD